MIVLTFFHCFYMWGQKVSLLFTDVQNPKSYECEFFETKKKKITFIDFIQLWIKQNVIIQAAFKKLAKLLRGIREKISSSWEQCISLKEDRKLLNFIAIKKTFEVKAKFSWWKYFACAISKN